MPSTAPLNHYLNFKLNKIRPWTILLFYAQFFIGIGCFEDSAIFQVNGGGNSTEQ